MSRRAQQACRTPPCPSGRARPLVVYLVVFQHVPVERCRQLIADVTGAVVSEGFIHSCLARAASLAADMVALIRALITASAVAGFDETTLGRQLTTGSKDHQDPAASRRRACRVSAGTPGNHRLNPGGCRLGQPRGGRDVPGISLQEDF